MRYPHHPMMRVKKIPCDVDNYTGAEKKRVQLIETIQQLHGSGKSIREISRITGKERRTVRKYIEGDPNILCRSNKRSYLEKYTDYIIKRIKDGMTVSSIAKQLQGMGQAYTLSNIRFYINRVAKEHDLKPSKYSGTISRQSNENNEGKNTEYITRKGIFNHLWMDIRLTPAHREYLWNENKILWELECCIRDFREIFEKKNMPNLYLFIARYKNSEIKEIASFANGLQRDISAVENAVASPLSNGFVEGTNSKIKTIKKSMYGRCGKLLLSAKLMYDSAG